MDRPCPIYLDYHAMAPVDPRVRAAMAPYFAEALANPSSFHTRGSAAKEAMERARGQVARLVGASEPGQIVFTSCATEATNLAVRGVALRRGMGRGHVITTAVEHVSLLNACRDLEKRGTPVTYVGVERDGRVAPEAIRTALRPDTFLISVGYANGEVGTIQPIREIGDLARERGILFHVDGVGAVGRVPVDVQGDSIDLLTLSSNDLYGPPGVGALYLAPGVSLHPVIVGGGQEGGLRGGTENLPGIVGMGVAAEIAWAEGAVDAQRLRSLRDHLLDGLAQKIAEVVITGSRRERLPHHASCCLPDVKGDSVVLGLDLEGIAASTGSVCASLTQEPSHVLRAVGLDPHEAEGSLVFTLGRWTHEGDVARLLNVLPPLVERLRSLSPLSASKGRS